LNSNYDMNQKQIILYSVTLLIGSILLLSISALLTSGSHQAFAAKRRGTSENVPLGGESSSRETGENINSLLSSISSNKCDQSLWDHVWTPSRLEVVSPCVTAVGTIVSLDPQTDGDIHVGLRPDPQYEFLLNSASMKGMDGNVNVEPICFQQKIKDSEAKTACGDFFQNIVIPPKGTHVRVTGALVIDRGAGGWTEIHPVTSFEPIP
jgi:hypothetical protein